MKFTLEFEPIPSEPLCRLLFGQEDHVRLFGRDVVDYFRNAGLNGRLFTHESVLPGIDAEEYGCNEKEPFFLFSKNPSQQFPF